jgi:hypothetical protein
MALMVVIRHVAICETANHVDDNPVVLALAQELAAKRASIANDATGATTLGDGISEGHDAEIRESCC